MYYNRSLAEFVAMLRANRGGTLDTWIHGTGNAFRDPFEVTVRAYTGEAFSSIDPAPLIVLSDVLRDLGRAGEADRLNHYIVRLRECNGLSA